MNPVESAQPAAQEPAITSELLRAHGITPEEYERILKSLGRTPTLTELGIFSVMWSEHCSYKSSRVHLKRLPTRSRRVVQGPGENAGIIDIGDGWACAFKIESHNHPSFIEPFQGATTGVGGSRNPCCFRRPDQRSALGLETHVRYCRSRLSILQGDV